MKNKSVILGIIVGIVSIFILLVTTACNNSSGGQKAGKNEYGFKSIFTDDYSEENQLRNYPTIKEEMLKFEPIILDTGLKIRKINFTTFGIRGDFYLGTDENAYDEIKLEFSRASEDEDYTLHSIEAKIYDDSMYEQAKKAMIKFAGLSDEEAELMNEVETTYKDDGIYTMTYYIDYAEREENKKMGYSSIQIEGAEEANNEKVTYKELRICNHDTESERQTTLYSIKREKNKPKADGENFDDYGLSFYFPNGFTANPYNGMLYTWDFYTGEYGSSGMPNGVDINIKINGLNEGKTFDDYVRNDSRPAKSTGVTPFETKEINGHTWYTCNNGRIYYYGAEFLGNTYEIEVKDGVVINGVTLQATLNMIEQTLFFE